MTTTSEKPQLHRYGYAIADMTVSRLLADKARKNGDKVFCTYLHDGRTFSYSEIDLRSNRLANGLLAAGLGHGSHVAVMMDNSPEQMLLHFAIMKIGAVSVPVNTAARGKLLAYFLNQSDSVAAIADEGYAERLREVLPQAPAVRQLLTDFGALEQHADTPITTDTRFSDLAMLCYTSGTTGPSKGNMYAQATVVQFGMTTAESHGYRQTDTVYISLPINHSNAYFAMWGALIAGGAIALSRKFSVSRFWGEVRASGATFTNLLGSMVNMLWSQPPHADQASHRLRACVMVPVPPFARDWEKRFNMRVVSSYGQTDYANVAVYTLVDPESKLGSAGRPRAGVELRIADEDELEVAPGDVGQILVRSNNPWAASLGYYKMPEATVASTRGLWWHTGDHGYIDEDGYLYFAGRKKDALRRRGENISAYEVELVLTEHPAIAEAAVFPVRSEMSEDEVAVAIVLAHGHALDGPALVAYCEANMAHYMVPRFVQFAAELPRTESHKVRKEELRRLAEADRSLLWDREANA